jgi:hypothetical protein
MAVSGLFKIPIKYFTTVAAIAEFETDATDARNWNDTRVGCSSASTKSTKAAVDSSPLARKQIAMRDEADDF